MNNDSFHKAAVIHITKKDNIGMLNNDLKKLKREGFRYIFVDEVTAMEDFTDGAALLADMHAAKGMKIVLSGTDSLGFIFAAQHELYARCTFVHTTYIPFYEFKYVLGIDDIDSYIKYGGTMSISGSDYNNKSDFENYKTTFDYTNTAIAFNIQNTLEHYQFGKFFNRLYLLYKEGELTNVINRIVEDMNHEFAIDVLIRNFKSHDLGISARNLRRDDTFKEKILDRVNKEEIRKRLMDILHIHDDLYKKIKIDANYISDIKNYFIALDFIEYIKTYVINCDSVDI